MADDIAAIRERWRVVPGHARIVDAYTVELAHRDIATLLAALDVSRPTEMLAPLADAVDLLIRERGSWEMTAKAAVRMSEIRERERDEARAALREADETIRWARRAADDQATFDVLAGFDHDAARRALGDADTTEADARQACEGVDG